MRRPFLRWAGLKKCPSWGVFLYMRRASCSLHFPDFLRIRLGIFTAASAFQFSLAQYGELVMCLIWYFSVCFSIGELGSIV